MSNPGDGKIWITRTGQRTEKRHRLCSREPALKAGGLFLVHPDSPAWTTNYPDDAVWSLNHTRAYVHKSTSDFARQGLFRKPHLNPVSAKQGDDGGARQGVRVDCYEL